MRAQLQAQGVEYGHARASKSRPTQAGLPFSNYGHRKWAQIVKTSGATVN